MNKLLFLIFILLNIHCNKSGNSNLHCSDESSIEWSKDCGINILTPNIIIADDPVNGILGILSQRIENNTVTSIIPEGIFLEITDSNDSKIFENSEITIFPNTQYHISLWDGHIDGVPYEGQIDFQLIINFKDDLTATIKGKNVNVITCQILQNCNGDCTLDDCRYFSQILPPGLTTQTFCQ